ncbi:MAG: D-alanine--D-alanine ligase [Clostridia bacterium]|nr:D-alanine--D-alanine ligase [Clostridia bacterium]
MANKTKKQVVAVIFGGKSVEHDISIITGEQVLCNLNIEKYEVLPIYISKQNEWYFSKTFFDINTFSENEAFKQCKKVCLGQKGNLFVVKGKKQKLFKKIDFAFLALHGNLGENGSIQGLLEMCDVPYSSPNVFGSSVCMNKLFTKYVCKALEINVVNFKEIFEKDYIENINIIDDLKPLNFPIIVKPNNLGSSVGISFCENESELKNAISFAFLFDKEVLVEEAVTNLRELNIAILGNNLSIELSSIEEVKIEKDFLTFENKYYGGTKGMESQKRICPAKIDENTENTIKEYGKKIFSSLGLKGCVRIDFLLDDKTKKVYLNEINTIPGSMANYLFKNKYSFSNLLEKLMNYALKEREFEQKKIVRFSSSVLEKFNANAKSENKFGANKLF